jgi:g-D-glutamyl-meso-diaminopimelate peptidase
MERGIFMKVAVRSGDSLWYYSRLFAVPASLLADSNPGADPARLQIGQEIAIPGFAAQSYTIRENDTFWKISASLNLSVDALLLLNQDVNPNRLQPGEEILIPARAVSPNVNGRIKYTFEQLENDIRELADIFPFIKVGSAGKSVLGKPLYEIRLGNGSRKVHLNASFHANEWITTSVLMLQLNTFLLSLTNSTPIRGITTLPLYNSVDLSIVPMVNPDGVNLVLEGPPPGMEAELAEINRGSTDFTGWKANIRGVDLNNQFPAKWEVEKERKEEKAPAPRDFPGTAPLTEPEAQAMAQLARNRGFGRMLAYHTQGEEFYWGYEGLEPPESAVLASEFARVSGYDAIRYVDSYAGYKDWFIKEFQRPGFTIELGKGINPLPLSQLDEIFEETLGIFLASIYM